MRLEYLHYGMDFFQLLFYTGTPVEESTTLEEVLGLGSTGNLYLWLLQQRDCVIITIIAMSSKRYFWIKLQVYL